MSAARLSRREFLVRTGWVAGGVTVLGSCRFAPVLPTFSDVELADAVTWLQLGADGRVRFLLPRAEMGQGIGTGLTQVVAEELLLPNEAIDCVHPRTDQISPMPMTVGSQSVEQFFEPVARAAATLRATLAERAAALLGVEAAALRSVAAGFSAGDGRTVAYGELVDDDEATVIVPDPSLPPGSLRSLLPAAERQAVGRVRAPVHGDRIVTGREIFSRDVVLEGMAFGAIARPPVLGASLDSANREAARAVPGIVAVVDGPYGELGVVAETPMAAARGVSALQSVWEELDADAIARIQAPLDVDRAIDAGDLDHTPIDEGSLEAGRARASAHLDARYDTPMVAHAAMEPRAGVARMDGGRCEVWTGSQDPWFVQGHVARALGLGRGDVVVHNQRIGGAFGGRALCQASVEAAWLAKGAGRPVKVQWSREEEFRFNYVGPQFSHRIQAGVTDAGEIAYWHHRMVGSPILTSSAMVPDYLHWAADLPADPGTWRGTDLPYIAPDRRVDFADVRTPMPTGAWRGLGAAPNTFAVECAIDELASVAGVDPLEFRVRHANDPRLAQVLERVRASSGWSEGREGLGVAAAAYKNTTFVAVVARAVLEDDRARVEHLWCAQDCGLAVCPDQVRAQIEGNLVWGIGMVLHEEFRLAEGIGATANFDTYRIPRNDDVPAIEVEIVASELPPTGSGEAAFAPAAAAIVNAIHAAGGDRVRALPFGRDPR